MKVINLNIQTLIDTLNGFRIYKNTNYVDIEIKDQDESTKDNLIRITPSDYKKSQGTITAIKRPKKPGHDFLDDQILAF